MQPGSGARQRSSAAELDRAARPQQLDRTARPTARPRSSTTQLDNAARQRSSTTQLDSAPWPARLCPRQAWPRALVREPGSACPAERTMVAGAADQLHCSPPARAGHGRSAFAPSLASAPSPLAHPRRASALARCLAAAAAFRTTSSGDSCSTQAECGGWSQGSGGDGPAGGCSRLTAWRGRRGLLRHGGGGAACSRGPARRDER